MDAIIEQQARELNKWDDPQFLAKIGDGEREALAYEQRDATSEDLEILINEFSSDFINDAEELRRRSIFCLDDSIKDSKTGVKKYQEIYDREIRRAENYLRLNYDGNQVDPTSDDGHCSSGLSMGWTSQGVKYMRAKLYRAYFDGYERPFRISMIGEKAEADELEDVATNVLEDLMLKRADYGSALLDLFNNAAVHGTGYLRCEFDRELKCRKDEESGSVYYEEISDTVAPVLTVFDNKDVLVTDWETSESENQEFVFYSTPSTSLPFLERFEAVFDFEVQEGVFQPLATVRKRGKFTNLYGMRRAAFSKMASLYAPTSTGMSSSIGGGDQVSAEKDDQRATTFPECGLIEGCGRINMAPYIFKRKFTPEVAQHFGVTLDRPYSMDDENDVFAFAQQMNKIYWRIGYTIDAPAGNGDSESSGNRGGRYLLRLDSGEVDIQRNDLFKIILHRGAKNQFMGLSINRLGRPMEDAADMLYNRVYWAQAQNANPNYLYYQDMLVDGKNAEKMSKLWNGMGQGFAIKTTGAGHTVDAQKVVAPVMHEVDAERAYAMIDRLKNEFESTTGVTVAAKTGQDTSGTNTATGMQITQGKTDLQDGVILAGIVRELNHKLMPYILEGVTKAMGNSFVNYALSVSGYQASETLAAKLISEDGWWRELRFDHPTIKMMDPAVIVSLAQQLNMAFPGAYDQNELARMCAEVLVNRPGRLMNATPEAEKPEVKVQKLIDGLFVEVLPGDDDMACSMALQKLATDIQGGAVMPPDPEGTLMLIGQLLAQHEQQSMMKMQMAMQQQAMAGGGGGPMQQGPNAGSNDGTPQESAEMAGQASGQANMVAGGAMT